MRILLGVLCVLGALFAVYLADWRNREVLFDGAGYIERGAVLGVQVGSPSVGAGDELVSRGYRRRQILEERSTGPQRCGMIRLVRSGESVEFYDETSPWRAGNVCVVSRDGSVVAVGWSFGVLLP